MSGMGKPSLDGQTWVYRTGGFENWHSGSTSGGSSSGGGDPDASYVVLTTTSSLSSERTLTAGSGISIVDNGIGSTVVISATGGGSWDNEAGYIVTSTTSSLVNERVLTAGTGINITDNGAGSTIVIEATGTTVTPADVDASYIVVSTTSSLPNERALAAGTGISITDNGAGSTIVIAATGGGGSGDGDKNASYVVISATGSLTNERVLTAGAGISINDGGANGNVTISAQGYSTIGPVPANYFVASSSNEWTVPTQATFVGIPELTGTIVTSGNPVFISANVNYTAQSGTPAGVFSLTRDGVNVGHADYGLQVVGPLQNSYNGNGSFTFLDTPPAGIHTYSVIARTTTGVGKTTAYGVGPASLMVAELRNANITSGSSRTEVTVAGTYVNELQTSIVPTRGPVLLVASTNLCLGSAGSWGHATIYRDTTNLMGTVSQVLNAAVSTNECVPMMMVMLDESPTYNASNTYKVYATMGSGGGTINKYGQQGTIIAWELGDINYRYATNTTQTSLGSSYTDVVSPVSMFSRGRPILLGWSGHINTSSGDGRSGWSFLKNGTALATSSKGAQLLDGEGSSDYDRTPAMFWIDSEPGVGNKTYQIAGKNVSGSSYMNQTPGSKCAFFAYELDPGPYGVAAGGWYDTGNKLSTTSSICISGADNATSPAYKGNDVYFFVSGTINSPTSSVGKSSLFGGDVITSGSIISLNDFGTFANMPKVYRSGRRYTAYDAPVANWINDGIQWRPLIMGQVLGYQPPSAASFTSFNAGSTSIVDLNGALFLSGVNDGSSYFTNRGYVQSLSTNTMFVEAAVAIQPTAVNFSSDAFSVFGVIFRESATAKSYTCTPIVRHLYSSMYMEAATFTGDASRSSNAIIAMGTMFNAPVFVRLRRNGATVYAEYSHDRIVWTTVDSKSTTSVFTTAPDQVGITICGANVTPYGRVLSYYTGSL